MKNLITKLRDVYAQINLANRLTILRVLLTPLFVLFLCVDSIPHNVTIALAVFVIASITDYLDGHFARTRMMVTEMGKFLDPIADKILVTAAMVCFAGFGWISPVPVVIILARDSIVSAVRLAAVQSEEKIVMPARVSGKVKTVITMVSVCAIMFLWMLSNYGVIRYEIVYSESSFMSDPSKLLTPIGNVFMYVSAGLTVFSGIQYIWDARDILREVFSDS